MNRRQCIEAARMLVAEIGGVVGVRGGVVGRVGWVGWMGWVGWWGGVGGGGGGWGGGGVGGGRALRMLAKFLCCLFLFLHLLIKFSKGFYNCLEHFWK